MSYRVKIESFEGPFQLLLNLVSEQRIDIGAISINEVADQYLGYVDTFHELDMDVASDFLVVAATLLSLKAAALLPDEAETFGDELDDISPDDAREILIARLIAYKQFKNIAAALRSRMENEGFMHARQTGLESQFLGLLPDYLEGVTLHGLAVICADLTMRREVFLLEAEHITPTPVPVELHIKTIIDRLEKLQKMKFSQLLDGSVEPRAVVVNFLALLELYHRGAVDLTQEKAYGDIEIQYRHRDEWTPAVLDEQGSPVDEFLESLQDGTVDETPAAMKPLLEESDDGGNNE